MAGGGANQGDIVRRHLTRAWPPPGSRKGVRRMSHHPRDFDQAATTWDQEPRRLKLAREVAQAIAAAVEMATGSELVNF